jgi:hypothetical protein
MQKKRFFVSRNSYSEYGDRFSCVFGGIIVFLGDKPFRAKKYTFKVPINDTVKITKSYHDYTKDVHKYRLHFFAKM